MSTNPRPTKRQRRSTSIASENEASTTVVTTSRLRRPAAQTIAALSAPSSQAGKTRSSSASKIKRLTISATSSPKSSPEKSRKSQQLSFEGPKNKSLHTFFNRVSEQERWQRASPTPEEQKKDELFEDDIIDDEDFDEALTEAIKRSKEDAKVQEPAKSFTASKPASAPPLPSQRFRKPGFVQKPATAASVPTKQPVELDARPWADRYAPGSLEELAVHKKKVQDVQSWLDDALRGQHGQRLLVLKGPAGAGKSTTIRLAAQDRNATLVAWQNPDTSESGALSISLQFAEFVTRGGDYSALSFDDTVSKPLNDGRILLVEEFPISLSRNSKALDSFRTVLLQATTMSKATFPMSKESMFQMPPPIVLIITETLVSSSTSYSDSFTTQRLLGPELIHHPAVTVIEFNPVAPTFLSKALDLIVKKEARESGRRRIPGQAIFQKLAGMGDLRNAINSLELLCTRGDEKSDWSGTVAIAAKRAAKINQPLSSFEENSLKMVTARETTLDMFHAAGKICYNKREDPRVQDSRAEPPPKPPDHLAQHSRPKPSLVDLEGLLNETGTDIQTFVLTVHQNYVLSCNHSNFVDYLDGCAGVLSDGELLDLDGRSNTRPRARAQGSRNSFQHGTSDVLRHAEIGLQVATRGLLFNLPFPVNRASLPGGSRGSAHKMYYPASLRLWRPIEETEGLLDLASAQLTGQASKPKQSDGAFDSVTSWKSRVTSFGTSTESEQSDDSDSTIVRTTISRESLVLDVLPFLTRIRQGHGQDTTLLRKITQLRGFNIATEEEPDPEVPLEPPKPTFKQKIEAVHFLMSHPEPEDGVTEPPIERLWLEDDDIEDD